MSLTITSMHGTGVLAASPVSSTSASALVAAPQQAPEQIPGGVTAGGGLVIVVVLGFLLHRAIEKKQAKWPHVIMAFSMGVLLAGSMVGVMAKQVTGSVGQGLSTMFSTVTGDGGTSGR